MNVRTLLIVGAIAASGTAAAVTPLFAHHSFAAEFDANKPVKLTGTVTKMDWINPHSWLYIDVKEPDGKTVNWKLEFGLPQALYRRGWRKTDLPHGATVTITGWRAKDGSHTANAGTVTLADGRRLFAGSSGQGAPAAQ